MVCAVKYLTTDIWMLSYKLCKLTTFVGIILLNITYLVGYY